MIRVGAIDFQMAFGAMSDMAEREPIVITKRGHDFLVVMSAEEYIRLKHGDPLACRTAAPGELRELIAGAEAARPG